MNSVKNVKNRKYYVVDDLINIKTLDLKKIKIDKKSYKKYSYLLHWIRDNN